MNRLLNHHILIKRIDKVLVDAIHANIFPYCMTEYDIMCMVELMLDKAWMGISFGYGHETLLYILHWHESKEYYEVCDEIYRSILRFNKDFPERELSTY